MSDYNSIDLNKVKEKVIEYCSIDDSKSFILNEDVNYNPLVIKKNLNLTNEALKLLNKGFNISFDGIRNINNILDKANKDIPLNGVELSFVLSFHYHCDRIKRLISNIEGETSLKDYGDSISINKELGTRIEKVIDASGNIKEDASDTLKDIFYKIYKNDKDIKTTSDSFLAKYAGSLQETSVFTRNDRTTFLIKNVDKNKFHGYQYGSSASGLAAYVEPEQFIELNNKRIELENKKIEEVNRILKELTYVVSKYADLYINNFDSLLKLDIIFSKAKYGFYNCGILASISENNLLSLNSICHPLIEKDKVVSNTYHLTNDYQGIVISGTNTGGKTVSLKLIGLSILMSYLGIPVIADKAEIPLFNNVYIDIDDNQSISNSLSTFSAHISNINEILNKANKNSLILIDELISGTDPKEAQAISLAILSKILEKGSKFVITTHYDDIKEFAYNNDKILLSSVGFDLENLKPTYKYLENSVGSSNAIDIAARYFDNKDIIDNARKYLELNKTKEDELLDKLSNEIAENEVLKNNLDEKIKTNRRLEQSYKDKIKAFDREKIELKKKYTSELNAYIDELKQKAQDKLESLNELDVRKEKEVIVQFDDFKEDAPIVEKVVLNVGDFVKVGESSQTGEIISIDNQKVSVNCNGMIIKTSLDNLTKVNKQVKKTYVPRQRMTNRASKEINLVGSRVEEGLVLLGNYLDNAYGSGLSSVKIIHGFGTGQLRKAVREYLSKSKIVESYDNGGEFDGGSNVTIVKFKS